MTSYIIKQIPDFPYKDHVINGASLALDWVEHLRPQNPVVLFRKYFNNKIRVVDDLAKPLDLKKKVVTLQQKYTVWNDEKLITSLEVVSAGADLMKLFISTIKIVDRYALSILSRTATTVLNAVASGVGLVASTVLVGIRAHGVYEKWDAKVTGENALIKAISRFLTSIYGLCAAILLIVALFVHIAATPLILLGIFTLMFLTSLATDLWVDNHPEKKPAPDAAK